MYKSNIDQEIYDRFIAPTKQKRPRFTGVEFEIPIVNRRREAVDFRAVHEMAEAFAETFGFSKKKYDEEGNLSSAQDPVTGDDLSFDCSYNTLEFSFGRTAGLCETEERFRKYYRFVCEQLGHSGHTLTGMGINPYFRYNRLDPIPNGRYRMLLHHLKSYTEHPGHMLFHAIPYYGLIACSSQTHLDVDEDTILQTIRVFDRLEPLKALLFANSLFEEEGETYLCVRDHLWRDSMHGWNPHNVDSWDIDPETIDEIVAYIRSMSLYCTERDGKYINFLPMPLEEFFAAEKVSGEYFDGMGYQRILLEPRKEDLQYLRSFKFVDLTFRGTVELRSTCMQPVAEAFTVPAFHVGLHEELDAMEELLHSADVYRQGYSPSELRRLFVKRELPPFAGKRELRETLLALVTLAERGLKKRGFGEERMLQPLWRRAEQVLSPAREMCEGLEQGKTEEFYIEQYGKR